MSHTPRSFVFAGGGTGGHIYPALAVADALRRRDRAVRIAFFCSQRPIDRRILDPTGYPLIPLPATGWSWAARRQWRFWRAWRASLRAARETLAACEHPVVVGVGGFVAAPAAWVAHRDGLPLALINVDAVAGKANRLVARWARQIYVQFEESRLDLGRHGAKCLVTGCPLRKAFFQADPDRARRELGLDPGKRTLLVTGASSGSQSINRTVTSLLPRLEAFADTWQLVHLTGLQHAEEVREATRGTRLSVTVLDYHDAMADLLAAADLVIGRSGAVSVAEYAAAGVPSICMPYPHHRDRHQLHNAAKLVEVGAAIIVDDVLDEVDRREWLWEELEPLLRDERQRLEMRRACRRLARPEAADRIAEALLDLAGT